MTWEWAKWGPEGSTEQELNVWQVFWNPSSYDKVDFPGSFFLFLVGLEHFGTMWICYRI